MQTSLPWVGFEPTILAFEGTTTVHALDRAATVMAVKNIALNKTEQVVSSGE
jgi:hypothetical protein